MRGSTTIRALVVAMTIALVGCGGDDGGGTDGAATVAPAGDDDTTAGAGAAETEEAAVDDGTGTGGGDASATLTLDGEPHSWTAEDMTTCEVDGIFPASADFGTPPSQGGEGPWVQFIDRGDGGVNFSAVIDGVEYMGTGSGEAEIGADGFSYSGTMGAEGAQVEAVLEVSC